MAFPRTTFLTQPKFKCLPTYSPNFISLLYRIYNGGRSYFVKLLDPSTICQTTGSLYVFTLSPPLFLCALAPSYDLFTINKVLPTVPKIRLSCILWEEKVQRGKGHPSTICRPCPGLSTGSYGAGGVNKETKWKDL